MTKDMISHADSGVIEAPFQIYSTAVILDKSSRQVDNGAYIDDSARRPGHRSGELDLD